MILPVKSDSTPGTVYLVTVDDAGNALGCTCPSRAKWRQSVPCKHMRATVCTVAVVVTPAPVKVPLKVPVSTRAPSTPRAPEADADPQARQIAWAAACFG